jgi:hypothetical protein
MSWQTAMWSVVKFARRSQQNIWACAILLLHHDNAPAHASLRTTEFVTNNIFIVPLPPYSPDLAPCDFAVSQIENDTEGMMFWNSVWHPRGIASGTQHFGGNWLSWRAWSVEKMTGSLYMFPMFPRRLFWKRWQTKLCNLSQPGTFLYTLYSIRTR